MLVVAYTALISIFDLFPPQDNIFRLASQFENGRGKSPYDPKMLSASLLLGKFDVCFYYFQGGRSHFRAGHVFLTILSRWQMESCTRVHLLTSWEGTLPFSVRWEIIIQSEQSSMIQDGWMVKKIK